MSESIFSLFRVSSPTPSSPLFSPVKIDPTKSGVGAVPSNLESHPNSSPAASKSISYYFGAFINWIKSLWRSFTGDKQNIPHVAERGDSQLPSVEDELSLDRSTVEEDFVEGLEDEDDSDGWYQFKQTKSFAGNFLTASVCVSSLNEHVTFPFRGVVCIQWRGENSDQITLEAKNSLQISIEADHLESFQRQLDKFQKEWQQKAEEEFSSQFKRYQDARQNSHLRRLANPQFEISCWAFQMDKDNSYSQKLISSVKGKLSPQGSTPITKDQYMALQIAESPKIDKRASLNPRNSFRELEQLLNPSKNRQI